MKKMSRRGFLKSVSYLGIGYAIMKPLELIAGEYKPRETTQKDSYDDFWEKIDEANRHYADPQPPEKSDTYKHGKSKQKEFYDESLEKWKDVLRHLKDPPPPKREYIFKGREKTPEKSDTYKKENLYEKYRRDNPRKISK